MSDYEAVRQVLARYVRAADARDGARMADLFVEDGTVEIMHRVAGASMLAGQLDGREVIAQAVGSMMKPHPPQGWSHHTTFDHIVELDGDRAEIDAQFIVYETLAADRPVGGWPDGAVGLQGSVHPIEAGYYRTSLVKQDGRWLIAAQRIEHDLAMAIPAG